MEPSEGLIAIITGIAKKPCVTVEICIHSTHSNVPLHSNTHTFSSTALTVMQIG